MERLLEVIGRETEAGYQHAFVLTRNVRDAVWEGTRYVSFVAAFARAISRTVANTGRLAARYSISQGIVLYRDGQIVTDNADADLRKFIDLTGLRDAVVVSERTADDLHRHLMEPADVLPRLYLFLRDERTRNSLVIDGAEYLVAGGGEGRHDAFHDRAVMELLQSWARDSSLRRTGGCIAFVCPEVGAIPPDIVRGDGGFRVLPIDYPDVDERRAFARGLGLGEEEAAVVANLTTGFRRLDVHEAVTRRFKNEEIARRKADLISARCGESVELVTSSFGLEMANAQPHVRRYLLELKDIVLRDRKSPLVPNGLLFVGVPGNGKTHLTKAFAHDCGMNMLRFKNVRSRYVGESERNLETILDLLPSLAPSVVFIDEVDQMVASRSGGREHDGGTEARLLGRLLEFMGDSSHRGDILWIAATNRPDLIDSAMLRRFDRIFPFMNPTAEARADLIVDLLKRLKVPVAGDFDRVGASALMEDFSCDEVEKVVRRSFEICLRKGDECVTVDHLRAARKAYKSNHDASMYELIALLSVRATNFRSDLPWFNEEGELQAGTPLPPFLGPYVSDDGTFRERQIEQRIAALRQEVGAG